MSEKTQMGVTVYFESSSHAEIVAYFNDEETYMACLPSLEKLAKKNRMIVTESCDVRELNAEIIG